MDLTYSVSEFISGFLVVKKVKQIWWEKWLEKEEWFKKERAWISTLVVDTKIPIHVDITKKIGRYDALVVSVIHRGLNFGQTRQRYFFLSRGNSTVSDSTGPKKIKTYPGPFLV